MMVELSACAGCNGYNIEPFTVVNPSMPGGEIAETSGRNNWRGNFKCFLSLVLCLLTSRRFLIGTGGAMFLSFKSVNLRDGAPPGHMS